LLDFGSQELGPVNRLYDIPDYDDFRTRQSSTSAVFINGDDHLRIPGDLTNQLTDMVNGSFNDSENVIQIYWQLQVAKGKV